MASSPAPSSSSSSSSSSSGSSSIPALVPSPSRGPTRLKEFRLFPQLPTEIRASIWKLTCLPRNVEMRYAGIYCDGGFSASADPPATLEVCRESRELLIGSYPMCFGSIYHPATTRFNFSMDVLILDEEFQRAIPHFMGILSPREISSIRYVAIASDIVEALRPYRDLKTPLKRALTHLSGLEELLIVYEVSDMSPRIHTDMDNNITLYEELPTQVLTCEDLKIGGEEILKLPAAEKLEDMEVWSTPKVRLVYGWRRCTCSKVIDMEIESNSEDDDSVMDMDDDGYWDDEDTSDSDDDPLNPLHFASWIGP